MTRTRRLLVWGISIAIVLVVIVLIARRPDALSYATARVERRDLARFVRVTGNVEAADDVALAFEASGRVTRVPARVGAAVAPGTILAALDVTDARAIVAEADAAVLRTRAQLAELRRGTRAEEIHVAQTDADNARRALLNAEAGRAATEEEARVDLANLYDDASDTLRDALTKADDAVRKQTDDLFTNDTAESPQLTYETAAKQEEINAEAQRRTLELALRAWSTELAVLGEDARARDAALTDATQRLDMASRFLDTVSATLNTTTNLSPTTVGTYRTNVHTARTNVNTARSAVVALTQAIAAQAATNRTAIAAAQQDATTKRNTLAIAEAKLALARAPATVEAIATQEALVAESAAALLSAQAKLAKLELRAPVAGIVTTVDARVGMIATAGTPLITVIADGGFMVEAHVPEVDLPGLMLAMPATVTLDAYGSTPAFAATVRSIDPAAVLVDGVPTYRVTFAFTDRDDRIRVGMTANVEIATARTEGALVIPQRAVTTRNGASFVRVLRNGTTIEVPVRLGLRGSDGYVEVLEGLEEGAEIIRTTRER